MTQAALDGETVAMLAHQLESEQMIERVPSQKFSNALRLAVSVAQVW